MEIPETAQNPYRWVVLALLWGLYAAFGLIARAIAPLVTPIIKDLEISYAGMGIILGAWQVTYILFSLIGGSIIDKWGLRISLFAGTLVMGLSASLRFFSAGFYSLLFAVALFGVGGPMISVGGPAAISKWFAGKSRGTAVGIYMTGSICGGLLALSITNSIVMPLSGNSWRLTFVCYGGVAFLVALLWLAAGRDRESLDKTGISGIVAVFVGLVRMRNVRIVLAMGLFSFAILHGIGSWLPKILETGGLSPSLAGFASAIPLAVSLPSIILVPRMVPPRLRGRVVALAALASSVLVLVVTSSSGLFLIAGLVLLGASSSSFLPLMMLMLMDDPEVESKYMGSAGGIFFCVAEIGGVTGPFLMGILVDLTGSFLAGALSLSGLGLVIAVLAMSLKAEV